MGCPGDQRTAGGGVLLQKGLIQETSTFIAAQSWFQGCAFLFLFPTPTKQHHIRLINRRSLSNGRLESD